MENNYQTLSQVLFDFLNYYDSRLDFDEDVLQPAKDFVNYIWFWSVEDLVKYDWFFARDFENDVAEWADSYPSVYNQDILENARKFENYVEEFLQDWWWSEGLSFCDVARGGQVFFYLRLASDVLEKLEDFIAEYES